MHWISYWDCVVVDAKKPLFFADGTILRRVDRVHCIFLTIMLWCIWWLMEPVVFSINICDQFWLDQKKKVLNEVIGGNGGVTFCLSIQMCPRTIPEGSYKKCFYSSSISKVAVLSKRQVWPSKCIVLCINGRLITSSGNTSPTVLLTLWLKIVLRLLS